LLERSPGAELGCSEEPPRSSLEALDVASLHPLREDFRSAGGLFQEGDYVSTAWLVVDGSLVTVSYRNVASRWAADGPVQRRVFDSLRVAP
jgi:hypothetical protein